MADKAADKSRAESTIVSIDRRQDRLLSELDQLNERIEQTLSDWAGRPKPAPAGADALV